MKKILMAEAVEDLLISRLDTLIKLQALSMVAGYESQKERIEFLNKVGLKPKEIGDLLGVSANSVSVALAKMKAAEKKKAAAAAGNSSYQEGGL